VIKDPVLFTPLSPPHIRGMLLPEQYEELESLAALGYTLTECANYFKIHGNAFIKIYADEESQLHYHYERGKLVAKAETEIKLLESAKSGNLTAQLMLRKALQEREFIGMRNKCLNGEI